MTRWILTLAGMTLAAGTALADVTVPIHAATDKGQGDSLGSVTVTATEYGLVFTPKLTGLTPGIHGFHLHENPSCDPKTTDGKVTPAGAAGGHYDPQKTGRHGAPWGDGHLGDLPALYVNDQGQAVQPVLAPRLKDLKEIQGRSLMVHAGGDNHDDHPEPLGGGGARIACGVVK